MKFPGPWARESFVVVHPLGPRQPMGNDQWIIIMLSPLGRPEEESNQILLEVNERQRSVRWEAILGTYSRAGLKPLLREYVNGFQLPRDLVGKWTGTRLRTSRPWPLSISSLGRSVFVFCLPRA
jgi:hypothetical protein